MYISEVMIKSITNFLIIFFISQQLKSQISKIDQNGYNPFCDETLQIFFLRVSFVYMYHDITHTWMACKFMQLKLETLYLLHIFPFGGHYFPHLII